MNRSDKLSRPSLGLPILTLAAALSGCGGEPPTPAPELRPVRTILVESTGSGVTRAAPRALAVDGWSRLDLLEHGSSMDLQRLRVLEERCQTQIVDSPIRIESDPGALPPRRLARFEDDRRAQQSHHIVVLERQQGIFAGLDAGHQAVLGFSPVDDRWRIQARGHHRPRGVA